jgi:hypothetical protein
MVRKNGKGAARLQKEKNGTITKDELVLFDKEGMHPLVWEFFVDELEKQGATPAFAAKHFKAPGIKGAVARGYGKLFGAGGVLPPERIVRLNQSANAAVSPQAVAYGPAFMAATLKGRGANEVLRSAIPKKGRLADALTFMEEHVPTNLLG